MVLGSMRTSSTTKLPSLRYLAGILVRKGWQMTKFSGVKDDLARDPIDLTRLTYRLNNSKGTMSFSRRKAEMLRDYRDDSAQHASAHHWCQFTLD